MTKPPMFYMTGMTMDLLRQAMIPLFLSPRNPRN